MSLTPLLLLLQVVLNQKFTDCFVLVFLDSHLGKTVRTKGEGFHGGCTPSILPQSSKVGLPPLHSAFCPFHAFSPFHFCHVPHSL